MCGFHLSVYAYVQKPVSKQVTRLRLNEGICSATNRAVSPGIFFIRFPL